MPPSQLKRVSFQVLGCDLLYKITYWSSKQPNLVKVWCVYTNWIQWVTDCVPFSREQHPLSHLHHSSALSSTQVHRSTAHGWPDVSCLLGHFKISHSHLVPAPPGPAWDLLHFWQQEWWDFTSCSVLHAHWRAMNHIYIQQTPIYSKA